MVTSYLINLLLRRESKRKGKLIAEEMEANA